MTNPRESASRDLATRLVMLTPLLAREWLNSQIANNRKISKAHVENLAREIVSGYWKMNGEAIKFNVEGEMIDGQHRCLAVIKANMPIDTMVVDGLPNEVFLTLDGRGVRKVADFLHVPNAKTHAAVLGWLHRWQRGVFPSNQGRLTPPEAEALEKAYPMVGWAVAMARRACVVGFGAPIGFLCLYYGHISPRANRRLVEEFVGLLADGSGMESNHPVFRLRERALTQNRGTRLDDRVLLALSIKAFKAFMEGRTIGVLKFGSDEEFPALD